MIARMLIGSLLFAAGISACGGKIFQEDGDAGPGVPDAGSDGPLPSPPDIDAAPDASPVHGVAWVDAVAADVGIPYVAASDGAGGVYVGTYQGVVARVASGGATAWTMRMTTLWGSNRNFLGGVAHDTRGNAVVAGDGLTLLAAGDGHAIWNVTFDGVIDTRGVAVLGDGTIVHVGFFLGSATFGSTVLGQPGATGGWVGFIVRYDGAGHAISANVLSDVTHNQDGPFYANTDEDGNLVLVGTRRDGTFGADTFDKEMHQVRSVSIQVDRQNPNFATGPGGSVCVSTTNIVTDVQGVVRIDGAGATTWTFHPPSSYVIPHALTYVVPDGARGAVAWVDTLWSIDDTGAGVEVVPEDTLNAAVANAIGRPSWVVEQGFAAKLVLDGAHDVFVVGAATSTSTGGGVTLPFVAKVVR